jgi:GH35 family endo-1,4-beta-xylanase
VKHLKNLNLLDGIGLQCHFHLVADTGVNGAWAPTEMATNLQRLADLGLRISFTEVDIRIPNAHTPMTRADSANLIEQRTEYNTLMGLFLSQPNCKSFFTWGVNDTQSWVPSSFGGYGSALLFSNTTGTNGEYVPKSDYSGVREALQAYTSVALTRNGVLRMVPPADASTRIYDLLGRRLDRRQFRGPQLEKELPHNTYMFFCQER